jgi:hypothetical protein
LVGSSSRSEVGSWGGGVLDYQDAISRPSGTADDAAPASRAQTRLEEDACPKSVGALGDLVDVRDLDVGQPRRPVGPALDDAAGEPAAPVERVVGAMLEFNLLCSPSAHTRGEGAARARFPVFSSRWTTGLGEGCIIGSHKCRSWPFRGSITRTR